MSAALNFEFQQDTMAFARRHAIKAGGAGQLSREQARQGFKVKHDPNQVGDAEDLLQVKGIQRIVKFDIDYCEDDRRAQDQVRRNLARVEVTKRGANVVGEGFLGYWLPWVPNEVIRTTLRPRRAQHGIQPDPDYFFTAGVNGCMVFVEGAREQPTVYHANASSTHGPNSPEISPLQLFLDGDSVWGRECLQAKVNRMVSRYRNMSRTHAKLYRDQNNPNIPRPPVLPTAGAVKQTDYHVLMHGDGGFEDERIAVKRALGMEGRRISGKEDDITIEDSLGAVWGVRQHGLWTFYFQKTVRVNRVRFKKYPIVNKWYPHVEATEWHALDTRQFWPPLGGASRFELHR